MNKAVTITLSVIGWLMIVFAALLIMFGVVYGFSETDEFYQRIDDYHALDDQRTAMADELDSLRAVCYAARETDSLAPCPVQEQIDSIENTPEYDKLFGTPEPPTGFSLAGLVTVFAILIALVPLILGIILVVIASKRRKKVKLEEE